MPPQTPYTTDLDGRDPIAALRDTTSRIGAIARGFSAADFERSYAPGKWSARQIMTHLAQTELALGTRARIALTTPNYAAQSFNQDQWMARESALDGRAALEAFLALAAMNTALFAAVVAGRPRNDALPPGIRRAERRLDRPPDGGTPDPPPQTARRDRGSRVGREGGRAGRREGKAGGREGGKGRLKVREGRLERREGL